MTVLLTASAVMFGVLAYRQLPVSDLPAVDYPVIQVSVSYPGATPETMANNIATPLEQQFMQIEGLDLVTSTSAQGKTSIVLQFDLNKSLDGAATDVQAAITRASGQLPVDLPSPPTFTKTNPNDQPIIYLGLVSDTIPPGDLHEYAFTQVGQRISILSGVSSVAVYGAPPAVRIKASPSALAIRGLAIDDLNQAIQSATSYQGAGQFDGQNITLLLQPQGQLASAAEFERIIIGENNRQPIYLKDVAYAVDSVQNERMRMRFWFRDRGIPPAAVVVGVFRQAGSNAVEVARSVRDLIPSIETQLPGSVQLIPIYDRSKHIIASVNDVKETLVIAFMLVIFVIFLFLGRATDTLIPAVAMPLSLLLVFIAMNSLGYSLDNLSLLGLTLAIGFLVDDAIVFLENTVRRAEQLGEAPMLAAINSAKEISFTILTMTLSLAAVFIPLVFMSGLMGRIFREFSVTIMVAILASGLVSLTLTPLMCSRLLGRRGRGARKNPLERAISAIEKRVLAVYGSLLWWFIRNRWISLVIWIVCFAGTIGLFKLVPQSFIPAGDSSFIRGVGVAQEGISPASIQQLQLEAEKVLQANPAVLMTFTVSGQPNFFPANQVLLLSFLYPPSQRQPIAQVALEQMAAISAAVPGLHPLLQPNPVIQISAGATATSQGQYAYAMSGTDPQQVYDVAQKLQDRLRQFDGFATVSSDLFLHTPNLQIDVLRDQADTYGVSPTRILTLLKNAYSQNYVYLIKKPTDQFQVILEVADDQMAYAEDLELLYIKRDDGQRTIPLRAVATWKTVLGPQSVNHINQFTSVTIFFSLKPGVPLSDATAFITQAEKELVPATIEASLQGEALTFRATVVNIMILMCLAVFVMYVILGILYESFVHPLTVLSALPVALVGGLATLYLFGQEASLYAFIGMFMLMGIVKKNGIMIVDFAIQRMNEGKAVDAAVHQASLDRFRPIVMTTLAAVMGALPIALGYGADGASRRPLGLVVVGGLLVSQFITLFVTPVICLYLQRVQDAMLKARSDREPTAPQAEDIRANHAAAK